MRHACPSAPPPRAAAVALALGLAAAAAGCDAVPVDSGARIYLAQGVIRGTVSYQGPRPCSRDGHIVGSAILLVFDRRNPPPPTGLATTAVNFVAVTGDVLFPNEPRFTGPTAYCPLAAGFTQAVAASAPFEVAPLAGASYEIRAFFDSTGDFLPEFSIRNLPEQGDIAGGAIDTLDALLPANSGNPNYQPRFLPIDVGVAQPGAAAGAIPSFVVPDTGFVADGVTVTLAAALPTPRPAFYPQALAAAFDANTGALAAPIASSSDVPAAGVDPAVADTTPILTIPQDIAVLAPPQGISPASANYFESKFPHVRLAWGVPSGELAAAQASPFDLQVAPFGQLPEGTGFPVWQDAVLDPATQKYAPLQIPEGNGVPQLWPQVVLERLPDPGATGPAPIVLLQGITLLGGTAGDTLLGTVFASAGGALFPAATGRPVVTAQDHLTVMLRPSVLCLPGPSQPGILVTPHDTASAADVDCSSPPCVPNGAPGQPVVPPGLLQNPALAALVNKPVTACLPTGRYALNVVYPDGQAWTVPNEAGVCAAGEGPTDYTARTCAGGTAIARPILYSQGPRAVVEIGPATDPTYCQGDLQVPAECLASP